MVYAVDVAMTWSYIALIDFAILPVMIAEMTSGQEMEHFSKESSRILNTEDRDHTDWVIAS